MIIDSHVHVGRWKYRYYSCLSIKIKDLNRVLDECGIVGAVVTPSDMRDNCEVLQDIRHNGEKKYWFFPWCSPRDNGCMKFLMQNRKNINGLKVHSSLDNVKGGITNKLYMPFLKFAASSNIPVFVHCGRWQEYASYKFVLEIASTYKDIRFIMAHLGGDFEGLKIEAPRQLVKSGLSNVWIDVSATREYWTIKLGIEEASYRRFIFGSDFPVMHPTMSIASISALNLGKIQKERIFSKNILEVLGDKNLPISEGEK